MSIKVHNLTKIYGAQKALDEVSFSIEKGEITGLLGPNGAGKSTMMKIFSCFIPQSSGEVWVNGMNTRQDPMGIRKALGYLPENNPLYTDMYIREYLGFVAGLYKLPKPAARIAEVIEMTGLGPEIHKTIGKLSKGFRQRVGLAQALIHDPSVLILDEPTSGLDPNQILEIRDVIRKAGANKTIILSTHIMQEVEAICQRVVIINKGKIVADNSTSGLAGMSKGIVRIEIEFSSDPGEAALKTISGIKSLKKGKGNVWEIDCLPGHEIRPALLNFAVQRSITVLSLRQQDKSLEQVFHELTWKNNKTEN